MTACRSFWPRKTWPAWLGEVPAADSEVKALLKPFPVDRMKLWPVDRAVRNWRNNGPQLIDPIIL